MTKERKKVILDCDTGSDDALAIMLAALSDDIDLLGVTCVAGNKSLEFTTQNTLAVIDALGAKVPVFGGCPTPMTATLLPNRRGGYNGFTGVSDAKKDAQGRTITYHTDRLPLPEPKTGLRPEHAVFWLIDTLMRSDGDITLVPTGPMTNIAMAMRLEPKICSKIKEIVFMGGGFKEFNATAAAEFNIWVDPEAAEIVLTSGVKCTMVPLDATHHANFDLADCERLRGMNTVCTNALAEMLEMRIAAYDAYQPQSVAHSAPLHDALALSYLIDPEVLRDVRFMRVDVDISGGFADGQTICDTRAYPDRPRNCFVALGSDNARFHGLTYRLLEKTK